MRLVFREVWRVLRDDGTLALNLGDSHASHPAGSFATHPGDGGGYRANKPFDTSKASGLKPKDLCMVPSRVALALQADGWYLRQAMPWLKKNPLPESCTDRPTTSHEWMFLLSKSPRYYWDGEAVKVSSTERPSGNVARKTGEAYDRPDSHRGSSVPYQPDGTGRNRRTGDWTRESMEDAIAALRAQADHLEAVLKGGGLACDEDGNPLALLVNPQPFRGAHFATFPPRLVEPFVKAGTSERGACAQCGAPWRRVVEKTGGTIGRSWHGHDSDMTAGMSQYDPTCQAGGVGKARDTNGKEYAVETLGWSPTCACGCEETVPATVLDPFMGAGTTAVVSEALGREWVGCELNPEYADMALRRIEQERVPKEHREAVRERELAEMAGQEALPL